MQDCRHDHGSWGEVWSVCVASRRWERVACSCAVMMSFKTGYHVAAILFIASQYDEVFSLWFDVACRLRPFILARLEQWATDTTLLSMFGLAGDSIRALRQTLFCIDALHGQLHNWACQQRFLGMLQKGTTWNRGGMLVVAVVGARAHVRRQEHSTCAQGLVRKP